MLHCVPQAAPLHESGRSHSHCSLNQWFPLVLAASNQKTARDCHASLVTQVEMLGWGPGACGSASSAFSLGMPMGIKTPPPQPISEKELRRWSLFKEAQLNEI